MQVAGDDAALGGVKPCGAAYADVLAHFLHQRLPFVFQCLGETVGAAFEHEVRGAFHEGDELGVAGGEVRLDVHFHDGAVAASNLHAEQSFGGGAIGLLLRLGAALQAHDVHGARHVPVRFRKRLLAVAETHARAFAQFLDHGHVHMRLLLDAGR